MRLHHVHLQRRAARCPPTPGRPCCIAPTPARHGARPARHPVRPRSRGRMRRRTANGTAPCEVRQAVAACAWPPKAAKSGHACATGNSAARPGPAGASARGHLVHGRHDVFYALILPRAPPRHVSQRCGCQPGVRPAHAPACAFGRWSSRAGTGATLPRRRRAARSGCSWVRWPLSAGHAGINARHAHGVCVDRHIVLHGVAPHMATARVKLTTCAAASGQSIRLHNRL